jgi:hypothetical protein
MDDDSRLALEQEIADLRFALRQATDRASLAEIKCSQLLAAGDTLESQLFQVASREAAQRLTDDERLAITAAAKIADGCDEEMDGIDSGVGRTLRALLERLK